MPRWLGWDKVFLLLVLVLWNQVIPVAMSPKLANPNDQCVPSERIRWRSCGVEKVGRFLPSHFDCQMCRKHVSVLTYGSHETLRHFHISKHFPRDQRLRLKTASWRVLDYDGDSMAPDEVERQRDRILGDRHVNQDREYSNVEDIIAFGFVAQYAMLPVLAKVSSSIEGLRLGSYYELVH